MKKVFLVFPLMVLACLSACLETPAQGQPPTIFVHPTNKLVTLGATTVFSVSATGAPPLSYRWFKDSVLMNSRTSFSLVLSNVSLADEGNYHAEVSNPFGTATSRTGYLSLAISPPVITTQPASRSGFLGGTASFTVTANGALPLFYQWRKDGQSMPGRTSRVLTLSNLVVGDAAFYSVIVTNSFGSVTSQPASLTLTGAPPSVFLAGTNILICPGVGRTLFASASGTPPLQYQWRLNGADLPGQNAGSLFIPSDPANVGAYSVVVTNNYGAVTSAAVTLELGPRMVEQPASTPVQIGGLIYLRVIANACEARYQWRFNGADISGQTNNFLSLSSAGLGNAGDYLVVVTDSFRSVTSAVAHVEVRGQAPVITYQPADIIDAFWITNITFGVAYYAVPAPTIQWRFNGVNLPEGTNVYLSLPGTPERQGGYSVVLSNALGVVTSRVAQFSFSMQALVPGIPYYGQPQGYPLCPETNPVFLYVSPVNPPTIPLFFQWRKDGAELPGATNESLHLVGTPGDAGDYTVVITNSYGAVTSELARVSLEPVIQSQPEDMFGFPDGSALSFYVGAASCAPIWYQWQRNGVNLSGETNSLLGIGPATLGDSGNYRVIVHNEFGAVTSRVARLEVVQYPPVFSFPDQPVDQDILAGGYAYFYTSYSGSPFPSAQWWFNDTPLPGETSGNIAFMVTSTNQAGFYYLVLSNAAGVVTSRVARLNVIVKPPEIVGSYPEDRSVAAGQYTYFYVSYEAAPPPSFQWRFNGVDIPGATNQFYNLFVASTNQSGGYSVVLRNDFGTATSRVAQLTVIIKPPEIITQPMDWNVTAGAVVNFHVVAEAAPPPTYQWRFNGANIPNATNLAYFFTAGFTNQEGGYSVVVRNEFGSVTSRVATLDIIFIEPRFVIQPQNVSTFVGGRAPFLTALSNNPPSYFQWQIDGVDLPGATNNHLYLYDLQTTNSGAYRVIAWNDAGRATSDVATLTVRLPDTLDRWQHRRPAPQGNDLYSVTHDGTRFLAVGDTGAIVTSTDGVDWVDSYRIGDSENRWSVKAGNGVYLCLWGDRIQASTNGIDWSTVGPEEPFYEVSVAYGDGRFAVLGQSTNGTAVAISTNGWDWEVRPAFTQFYPVKLAYAGGLFLASCRNPQDAGDNHFFASPNALGWVPCSSPSFGGPFTDFAFGGGMYASVSERELGFVALSPDGLSWSTRRLTEVPAVPPTTVAPRALAYGAGRFVAVGSRYGAPSIASSTDGQNWSHIPGVATNGLVDVTFAAGRFVAVGPYGAIATSTDGVNWSDASVGGSDRNLRDITRGGGLYVAVGNGGMIFTSPDGRAWTERDSGAIVNLRAATYFKNHFVVVGDVDNAGGTVLNSADGVTWNRSSAPASFYGLTHDGERLIAVGNGGVVLTSTDGLAWSSVFNVTNFNPSPGSVDLNAVTWGGGRFVAVGRNGRVLVSTNGWQWAATPQIMPYNLHGIAYGNGLYVAVARNGWVARSTNATDWQSFNLLDAEEFSDVSFGGGQFIAVGQDGQIYSTTNGLDWLVRPASCQFDLRAVLYAEGSFFIAGDNETILQSPQIVPALRIAWQPTPAPGGRIRIELLGEVGRAYRLQVSENLQQWSDLHSFTASQEVTYFAERLNGTPRSKYYRLVSP